MNATFIALCAIAVFPIIGGWIADKGQPDPSTPDGKRYYK